MPAPLKVDLSEEEDKELLEFQKQPGVPQRVKERAEMVRLNHYGWSTVAWTTRPSAALTTSVAAIAKYKDKSPHTVRASLHRWQQQGKTGLGEGGNRGRKRRWLEEDLQHLETCLEQDQRTYNASQLAQKLAVERGVTLSADRLRKLLKKRGGVGKGQDTLSHPIQTPSTKRLNKPT